VSEAIPVEGEWLQSLCSYAMTTHPLIIPNSRSSKPFAGFTKAQVALIAAVRTVFLLRQPLEPAERRSFT